MTADRVLCAHDYVLMQDSCPGCAAESETPHPADVVDVRPSWTTRVYHRCRQCAQVASHPIHKKGGSSRG